MSPPYCSLAITGSDLVGVGRRALALILFGALPSGGALSQVPLPLDAVAPVPPSVAEPNRPVPLTAAAAVAFSPRLVGQLPLSLQMHGTAVVGSRLYVMGGNNEGGGWLNQVWSAPILPDSRSGTWRQEALLPERRAYISNATQVINDHIYIVGGSVAEGAQSEENRIRQTQTVLYTKVGQDGSLNPWKTSDPFPGTPRSNSATASTMGLLYVTGGAFNRQPIDDVMVARIDSEGRPVDWRVVGKLPHPLWFHGVAVQQERLFVWGGLTGQSPASVTAEVWSAAIQPDGSLSSWRAEKPLPAPLYSAANSGFNDRLVAVSGRNSAVVVTQNIVMGQIRQGVVLGWRTLTTDLRTHLYHSLGVDEAKGAVYVVGGRQRTSVSNPLAGLILTEIRAFEMGGGSGPATVQGQIHAMKLLSRDATPPKGQEAVIYFYSRNVPSCERFEREVLATPAARALLSKVARYRVDASVDSNASYRYGLFKFPSMARIGADGQLIRASAGLRTLEDLEALMR